MSTDSPHSVPQDVAAIRSCLHLYGTWRQQQKERAGALAALKRLEEQLE